MNDQNPQSRKRNHDLPDPPPEKILTLAQADEIARHFGARVYQDETDPTLWVVVGPEFCEVHEPMPRDDFGEFLRNNFSDLPDRRHEPF